MMKIKKHDAIGLGLSWSLCFLIGLAIPFPVFSTERLLLALPFGGACAFLGLKVRDRANEEYGE